jgi:hypothetical protein
MDLARVAPAFVEMAHRMVWATVATVDPEGRPRTRILHPIAEVWRRFAEGPEPVGYDPAIIPVWADGPTSPRFAGLRLEPWRLRVQPAAVMLKGAADQLLRWPG